MALPCWFTNTLEHRGVPCEEAPGPPSDGPDHGDRVAETIVLKGAP